MKNIAKMPWSTLQHDYDFSIVNGTFTIKTSDGTYVYPLKIIATVAPDSYHWAWDNHPMNFPAEVIYDGPMVEKLDPIAEFDSSEDIFITAMELCEDQPGMIYRFFIEHTFVLVYVGSCAPQNP